MTGPVITLILAAFVVVVGFLSYNRRQAGPSGGRTAAIVLALVVIVALALLWILHHRHGGTDPSAFSGAGR